MGVYSRLLTLSTLVLRVGIFLYDVSEAIANIWLIGQHLAGRLATVGGQVISVGNMIATVANEFYRFVQGMPQAVTLPSGLFTLLYWVDDLISMVRYFDEWVEDYFRRHWYDLYSFARNPASYIVNLLIRSTGLDAAFLYNPRAAIESFVIHALGNVRTLIDNPGGFITNVLRSAFPLAYQLLIDPDGWLINRIQRLSPVLTAFLSDPDGFVFERLRARIENRIAEVAGVLQSLATKILSHIW